MRQCCSVLGAPLAESIFTNYSAGYRGKAALHPGAVCLQGAFSAGQLKLSGLCGRLLLQLHPVSVRSSLKGLDE